MLAWVILGLCGSFLTCEGAPLHIRPEVKDAYVEGVLHYPVSFGNLQYPSLSLDALHVTITTPDLILPWGHTATTEITVGRQRIQWGPGITGGLLLSDQASLDGLTFQMHLDTVTYTQIQAARDFEAGRWLLAHRVELRALPNLKIGVSEVIAVSGGFRMQFAHLIPACPYYLIQHLTIKEDREQDRWTNALISADASIDLRDDLLAYAEFMADDFPWAMSAKGRVPYMVGGLVGISLKKPEACSWISAEYVRINNYVYSHKNPDNTYITKDRTLIGHPLGPDADGVYLIFTSNPNHVLGPVRIGQSTFCLGYERHGEGAPGQPWRPSDGIGRAFLSGIVETRTVLKASAVVHWGAFSDTLPCSEDFLLNLSFEAESIENAGHVLGERALEGSITVTLRLRYSPHDF